jgi:lipoate-protein ligase A
VSDWVVERDRDTATRLHDRSADLVAPGPGPRPSGVPDTAGGPGSTIDLSPHDPPSVVRRIRVLEVTAPAIVLGRAEPEGHVDRRRAAAAGVEVARRRSGGGAVLVVPGTVWIDIVVPSSDPLWSADVGRAMWWVGEAWVGALAEIGVPHADVWRGAMQRGEWSDRVCFAGLGAGEVTRRGKGGRRAKVVGVAQRRTRWGALFQCCALDEWKPEATLDVLDLADTRRRAGAAELAEAAVGVGRGATERLVQAVIERVVAAGSARGGARLP